MIESGDQVGVTCPACSPNHETIHEVLSPGGQATVRCGECGHVHTSTAEDSPTVRAVRTIVSQDGESVSATMDLPDEAILEVGDRFVVDTEEAVYSVELTDIEDQSGGRHERHRAGEIETLWTRDIGNVSVNVTVNPARGGGGSSWSARQQLPGDETVSVGDEFRIDGTVVRVTGLLLRETTTPDGVRTLDTVGDESMAMDLERIYARPAHPVRRDPW